MVWCVSTWLMVNQGGLALSDPINPDYYKPQDAEKAKWYIDRWVDCMEARQTPRYKTEGDKAYRLDVTTGE